MGFVRRTMTKMGTRWPAPISLHLWTLQLSRLSPSSSKFHILITLIKLSPKFEYGFCQMNDDQDGRQNACLWPVCTRGHS